MLHWLAVVNATQVLTHVPVDDLARAFGVFDGLDINLGDTRALELSQLAHIARRRVRVHRWVGSNYADPGRPSAGGVPHPPRYLEGSSAWTVERAHATGRLLGSEVIRHGAERLAFNDEIGVWRGPVKARDAAGNPIAWHCRADGWELVRALLGGLRDGFDRLPIRPELARVGLDLPWSYGAGTPSMPPEVDAQIASHGLMAYSTVDAWGETRNLQALDAVLGRARRQSPGHRVGLWVGVGRQDARGAVIGSDEAMRRLVADGGHGVDEIVWYLGNGAWPQLATGNPQFPPLCTLVPELRAIASAQAQGAA